MSYCLVLNAKDKAKKKKRTINKKKQKKTGGCHFLFTNPSLVSLMKKKSLYRYI